MGNTISFISSHLNWSIIVLPVLPFNHQMENKNNKTLMNTKINKN